MTGKEKTKICRPDPETAKRALKEAEERRVQQASQSDRTGKIVEQEFNGRNGPEPTRFGDWENKGIASDF